MNLSIASRARPLKQSEIRAMTAKAVELGGVNLSQGLCDLPTPDPVKEAAALAIARDCNTYAPLNGLKALRERIATKLLKYNRITADPETEISVMSGATGAYTCALLALLETGDKVLTFEPFYGYHVNVLKLFGFEPVFVRLAPPDWRIDFGLLEETLAKGVRAVVLNTPANPTGKVFTRVELQAIGALCSRYGVSIVTDEIYEYIVFAGHEHVSVASLDGLFERTVTVSGFSKTFAMTGWRLGYAAGPAAVIEKMSLISDLLYICAPHPLQAGLAAALPSFGESYYKNLPVMYDSKRRILTRGLEAYGFEVLPLEGTYFLLADYRKCYGGISSLEAAGRLLEEKTIASVPAASFFSGGHDETWLRFCFAKEDGELGRASELLSG
ncbi:MAG TPA: pyridoxal phosphate-dependent aminotransferase [archaeon]|nr:pyridoxal phosphate-dependent aminotransferase [archaeon]